MVCYTRKYQIPFEIDDEDYPLVSQHSWCCDFDGYIVTTVEFERGKYKSVGIHRLIMNTPVGLVTDHINNNKLDNRKANLRICSHAQNVRNNRPQSKSTSRYKGVYWRKDRNKWVARIKQHGKTISLGHYTNESEAALAYNVKAKELFGEYAWLNIID